MHPGPGGPRPGSAGTMRRRLNACAALTLGVLWRARSRRCRSTALVCESALVGDGRPLLRLVTTEGALSGPEGAARSCLLGRAVVFRQERLRSLLAGDGWPSQTAIPRRLGATTPSVRCASGTFHEDLNGSRRTARVRNCGSFHGGAEATDGQTLSPGWNSGAHRVLSVLRCHRTIQLHTGVAVRPIRVRRHP
jgi:hypothetical protein